MLTPMPKLWTDTIEAHRREVRDAILDTTALLASEHGVLAITMSQIAEETGIGRATLYKYFTNVESILVAWHERQIDDHLKQLAELRDGAGSASQRLEAVLETYALISHETHGHQGTDLSVFLHRGHQVDRAQKRLHAMIRDLLTEAVADGEVRGDVPASELATYCIQATGAASDLSSKPAVKRLVMLTLTAVRAQ